LSIETPDVESALALGRLHGEASDAVEVPYGGSTGLVGAVTVGGVRIQLTGPRRRVDKQDH
jgi:hypothetical protein